MSIGTRHQLHLLLLYCLIELAEERRGLYIPRTFEANEVIVSMRR